MIARAGSLLLFVLSLSPAACTKPAPGVAEAADAASGDSAAKPAAAEAEKPKGVLASGLSSPSAMIATDAHVYVADGKRVVRVPIKGGELETVATGEEPITALALSGQDVVWLTARGVYSVRSVNTKTFPVHTVRTGDTYYALTASEGDIFIAEGTTKGAALRRVKDATTAIVAELKGAAPTSIAADKRHVFVARGDDTIVRVGRFAVGDVTTFKHVGFQLWRLSIAGDDLLAFAGEPKTFDPKNPAAGVGVRIERGRYKVPKDGGPPKLVTKLDRELPSVDLGANGIYVATERNEEAGAGGEIVLRAAGRSP